jgi:hypothetical protein
MGSAHEPDHQSMMTPNKAILPMLLHSMWYLFMYFVLQWILGWRGLLAEGLGGKPLPTLLAGMVDHGQLAVTMLAGTWLACLALAYLRVATAEVVALLISLAWVLILCQLLRQLRDSADLIVIALGLRGF